MKKILSLLLVFAMCLSLYACGGSTEETDNTTTAAVNLETTSAAEETNESTADDAPSTTELALAAPYTVEDYAQFTLFKVSTTENVTASLAARYYYENTTEGETFVDMILDWTNTSTQAISSSNVLTASATNSSGTVYTNCLYAVETNNASYMSQYEDIAPLSTVRLHCAVSVPESETDLTLKLNIQGTEFAFDYTVGNTEVNASVLAIGDTVEAEDFAALVFNGIEYTDDVLPSNTSGSYSHYTVDNASNTYLVVRFAVTNYQSAAKDCDTFIGVKATYMDKYTYTGSVVVEADDGKGFSAYESISPLSTRQFYYMIEVPKTVTENEVALTISFNGQEYTYTG